MNFTYQDPFSAPKLNIQERYFQKTFVRFIFSSHQENFDFKKKYQLGGCREPIQKGQNQLVFLILRGTIHRFYINMLDGVIFGNFGCVIHPGSFKIFRIRRGPRTHQINQCHIIYACLFIFVSIENCHCMGYTTW